MSIETVVEHVKVSTGLLRVHRGVSPGSVCFTQGPLVSPSLTRTGVPPSCRSPEEILPISFSLSCAPGLFGITSFPSDSIRNSVTLERNTSALSQTKNSLTIPGGEFEVHKVRGDTGSA